MPTDVQADGEASKIEIASSSKLLKGVYDVRDIEATPRIVKGVFNVSELEAAATSTMHENAKFIKGIFNVSEIEAAGKTAKGFDAKQYEIKSFGSFASNSNVFYQGLYIFECEFNTETIRKEGNLMIYK